MDKINLEATLPPRPSRPATPFSASEWVDASGGRALVAPIAAIVDRLLALPALARLYGELPQDGRPFWDRALEALEIDYAVDGSIADLPATGPLIVVANHPYGGLDGLILGSLVTRVRSDVRILANRLLAQIPEVRRASFLVDPFGRPSASPTNAAALRAALQWVVAGGAVAAFPSGEVAHRRDRAGRLIDSAWSPTIARLAARATATVVPVYFEGGNSHLFTAAGRLHPRVRTALLVRELLRKRGARLTVRIGKPIAAARLQSIDGAANATAFLRLRTEALASDRESARADEHRSRAPIAAPHSGGAIAHELAALDPSSVLATSGALRVVVAEARDIPHVLDEIGRLREIAFRAAGEGSGLALDLDRFDATYLHLIAWNTSSSEIVGAYRVGPTDRVAACDVEGLYTRTLFRYDHRLLNELGPALELGRAFVRPEYQRDYSPLLLLWKGIGAYVVRNPRYRWLFGTVSISARYRSMSQQIMAAFLQATSVRHDLTRLVAAMNPPEFLRAGRAVTPAIGSVVRTIADVGTLIAEIESDGKGVPVLLRQYLKLNAKLLGFNVDPAFGGVLDGLMAVDLMALAPDLRARYMGKDGSDAFVAYHELVSRPAIQNCASHT